MTSFGNASRSKKAPYSKEHVLNVAAGLSKRRAFLLVVFVGIGRVDNTSQ
jgi:hypothetical protein